MNRRRWCKGTNRDIRDGDGPLQIARHIAPVANRLEWNDLHPLYKANISDNRCIHSTYTYEYKWQSVMNVEDLTKCERTR